MQEGELLTALQLEPSWLRSGRSDGSVLEWSPAERQSWQGHSVTAGVTHDVKHYIFPFSRAFFSFSFT